jgi:RNA polymerase sigma factor for flagellar operon FliA
MNVTPIESKRGGRTTPIQSHELWARYKATGDLRLRNRLVMAHMPMVQYIVSKKVRELPARCEVDDFVSCGLIGLIGAIERYDPGKGATLEQYAWTRIQGAVIDELRRMDWAPRSLRRWERDIHSARQRFSSQYGRAPSREELAEEMGVAVEDVHRKEDEVALAEVVSLNSVVKASADNNTEVERLDVVADPDGWADPERAAMSSHGKELFRRAFAGLGDREREIAVMLYLQNMTLREIGEHLGVSESRVCQLHAQIKAKLRARLADDEDLLTATG